MTSILRYAPKLSIDQARQIGRDVFGISGECERLASERDQNFRLKNAESGVFVLKVANANETFDVLDMQNKAMQHINRRKAAHFDASQGVCPMVCLTGDGETMTRIAGDQGQSHFVRLLTYLPGKPFAEAKPHHPELLRSLGRFFGSLDRTLADFEHPAEGRMFHWDLKQASPVVRRLMPFVADGVRRELVAFFLERYEADVMPVLKDLRQQTIHSDGNDYNVLVGAASAWQNRVDGVIDFGDMVHTHLVNELAILCAYAMMNKQEPLEAARLIVEGYCRVQPLEELELSVLTDLICMRLCMSVCHSADQYHREPGNEYLRISEKPAWDLLQKLRDIHSRFATCLLRDAGGLPPVPRAAAIESWLMQNRSRLNRVVDADFESAVPLVLDLSVGSPLMTGGAEQEDPTLLSPKIFSAMRRGNTDTAIGRYDEARCFYTSDAYRIQGELRAEHRTVHLGIDLFQAAGSRVYACRDGKVHSFADNSARFDYGPTIILAHETDEGIPFFTLYGHLSRGSLKGLRVGRPISKGEAFACIGDERVNGGWPPHLHFQVITDMLGNRGDFPGVARPSQRNVWRSISPDPNLVLGIPPDCLTSTAKDPEAILRIRQRHIGRNFSISYQKPLKIVRGRAQYLFDQDGQSYLDGVNNVCHVGHCHPDVVAAGQRQMAVLNTNTRYLHDHIVAYAEKLLSTFPDPLSVCFLVCTGSEANELALRLARTYTGRQDIIALDSAYHGNTNALIDISPYKHDGPGGKGAPAWVHTVEMPDGYRGPYKGTGPEVGERYAAHVGAAVEKAKAQGGRAAAFICESILGCGGQVVLPQHYLQSAFRHVRDDGGVCIVDEVQVGFGRAGSHFWAFETQNVVPDIVTLGKPAGNGHPLAVVVTTPEIANAFHNGMEYFNTFGGNPVSCAIGMSVLDVIEKEGLQANALKVGNMLLNGFEDLKQRYPLIGDVRGLGLFMGIELVLDRETLTPAAEHADYIVNRLQDHGILLSTDGPLHNVLKFKPPMVFSEGNAVELLEALDRILREDCLQV